VGVDQFLPDDSVSFRRFFLASTIFATLVRISSSEALAHRNFAKAEAAAFFFRRLAGPHRARAALRARAERCRALKALLGF
jgi:hypothetical protein